MADVDEDENTAEILNFYYHRNRLGSITHMTIGTEDVVEQYSCDPYGNTTIRDGSGDDLSGHSAIGNPFIFTAREYDEETGRYHYRHRAYDPGTGRFAQRDPLGYAYGESLYEYCNSRPCARTDPSGKGPAVAGAAVAAAGAAGWQLGTEIGNLLKGDGFSGVAILEAAGAGAVAGALFAKKMGVSTVRGIGWVFGAGFCGGSFQSLLGRHGSGGPRPPPPPDHRDRETAENAARSGKPAPAGVDVDAAGRRSCR